MIPLVLLTAVHLLGQDPASLPANTFWIEGEDYDYWGGNSIGSASTMPYAGGEFSGLEGFWGIDLHTEVDLEDAGYRGLAPVTMPITTRLESVRPGGFPLASENRHLAVEAGTSWFNYTRRIPMGTYRVYAVMSHEYGDPGNLRGTLARVINGRGTPNQELVLLGSFSARGSGGWNIKHLVPLVKPEEASRPLALQVQSTNLTTLRFTREAGTFDWLALVPTLDPEVVANPRSGFVIPDNSRLTFNLTGFDTRVDLSSIQFRVDGIEVSSRLTVSGDAHQCRVYYRHPTPFAVGSHVWRLRFLTEGDPAKETVLNGGFTAYVPTIKPDLLYRRERDLQFAGDLVYSGDGLSQTVALSLAPGDRALLRLVLRNRGSGLAEFRVNGAGAGDGWELLASLSGTDRTTEVMGGGYTLPAMLRSDLHEFHIELRSPARAEPGTLRELFLKTESLDDPTKIDTVRLVATVVAMEEAPLGREFTDAEGFSLGTALGLVESNGGTELRLASSGATLPYLWVPNSNDGTISKVDTRTGKELGRYRTSPLRRASPSRSAVDRDGNCWVANRGTGTIVKFGLLEAGEFDDRNHNGLPDTSRDLNGDGDVLDSEVLPWGADECVMFEVSLMPGREATYVPGTPGILYSTDDWAPGPRGLAVDLGNRIWASTYNPARVFELDSATGRIRRMIDLSGLPHNSYGLAFDNEGYLWSSGHTHHNVIRVDPTNENKLELTIGHISYGLGLDRNRHLFVSGYGEAAISRVNLPLQQLEWTRSWEYVEANRGLVCTDNGDIWSANSVSGTVGRWSNGGVLKTNITVGREPTGVAVDSTGKVWVVNNQDNQVARIDPVLNAVDLRKTVVGTRHYGYSDLTGYVSRNVTAQSGSWSVIHDGRNRHARWGRITWNATVPGGSTLRVRVRSSEDGVLWSHWESAINGRLLVATPHGRFLEVGVDLLARTLAQSPVLFDLSVAPATAPPGTVHFATGFDGPWQGAFQPTNVTQSFSAVHGALLGPFQDRQPVRFDADNLPDHSAVELVADIAILGDWQGNNPGGLPGRWDLTLWGRGGRVEAGRRVIDTTFSQALSGGGDWQAYPGTYPWEAHPPGSESIATNVLGLPWEPDLIYRLTCSFAHSGPALNLELAGQGLPGLSRWALDHFELRLLPPTFAPRLIPLGRQPDGSFRYELHLQVPGNVRVDRSENLAEWIPVRTNWVESPIITLSDPAADTLVTRFFRAVLLQ